MKKQILVVTSIILIFASITTASASDCENLIRAIEQDETGNAISLLPNVNVNCTVLANGTPLIAAVRTGNQRMVKTLVNEFNADVNKGAIGDGSPLIQASRKGFLLIAKFLITKGADVNLLVKEDETPLINASAHGHLDIVKLLVSKGADVNKTAWVGLENKQELRSPLNMAERFGFRKVAKYLKLMGAKD